MALNKIISECIKDGEVKAADIAVDAVGITDLSATGTASSSTYLRGDIAWAAIPAGVGGAVGADFNDDVKVRWGTDNDLEILHDDTSGQIRTTKGSLDLDGKTGVSIKYDGSTSKVEFAGAYALFNSGYHISMLGADSNNGAKIELHEDSSAVGHKTTIKGANAMAADWTITLPSAAPTANGQSLTATTAGVASWADPAAGAGCGGSDKIFWENDQTVTTNYTITNNKNAGTWGPVTINS